MSEGSYYTNPYYRSDMSGAEQAGLLVAPYAFAIPNYSGGALQADYALDQANYAADGQTLPLILDIEYDPYDSAPPSGDGTNECYGLSPAQMVAWIAAFTAEADRRTGQLPVIYTTPAGGPRAPATVRLSSPTRCGSRALRALHGPRPVGRRLDLLAVHRQRQAAGNAGRDRRELAEQHRPRAGRSSRPEQPARSQASLQLHALDGGGPITYSQTGLPSGVQLNASTGALSGLLPGSAAPFPVAVTASAAGDPSVTQHFAWDVHGKVALRRLSRRTGSVGTPVRFHVAAADGLAGCTLRFSASGLPRGVAISSCGWISGWPSVSGRYTVRVRVTDSTGAALATGSFRWQLSRASGRGPAGHIRLEPRRQVPCCAVRVRHRDRAVQLRIEAAVDDRRRRLGPRGGLVPGA